MNYRFFMTAKGSDHGAFPGDSPHAGDGKSECLHLRFKGTTNNDPTQGKEFAARGHEPLTVVKPWGPSSPLLMAAFWNNEILSVDLLFPQPDGKGNTEAIFHEIHLESATIAAFELRVGEPSNDSRPGEETPPQLEHISFRFEKMTVKNLTGKTVATFDFKNRG